MPRPTCRTNRRPGPAASSIWTAKTSGKRPCRIGAIASPFAWPTPTFPIRRAGSSTRARPRWSRRRPIGRREPWTAMEAAGLNPDLAEKEQEPLGEEEDQGPDLFDELYASPDLGRRRSKKGRHEALDQHYSITIPFMLAARGGHQRPASWPATAISRCRSRPESKKGTLLKGRRSGRGQSGRRPTRRRPAQNSHLSTSSVSPRRRQHLHLGTDQPGRSGPGRVLEGSHFGGPGARPPSAGPGQQGEAQTQWIRVAARARQLRSPARAIRSWSWSWRCRFTRSTSS